MREFENEESAKPDAGKTMKTVGVYDRPERGWSTPLLLAFLLASVLVSALVVSWVAA